MTELVGESSVAVVVVFFFGCAFGAIGIVI
jgi:hypothetical protein